MRDLVRKQRVKSVNHVVNHWPVPARRVARDMVRANGQPHEVTRTMLIWYHNGSWKRTIVHSDGVLHNFPRPHRDYLEQTIDYRVTPEQCSALAAFDGSIIVDRTRGELSARCNSEAMNFLIINLAHDILIGLKTVEQARRACSSLTFARRLYWPEPYAEKLQFTTENFLGEPENYTPDPDRSLAVMRRV